jgi:hypothetical protein
MPTFRSPEDKTLTFLDILLIINLGFLRILKEKRPLRIKPPQISQRALQIPASFT